MPPDQSGSPSQRLNVAARAAAAAAGVATTYQLAYLLWFHRTKPTVLLSAADPTWFFIPLGTLVLARVAIALVRGDRSDPGPGGQVRRLASWMLAASLLQFPLRVLGPFEDRVSLELVTVAAIVAIRELDFGRTRWIGPAAIACFMAWLPLAPVAGDLDGGAYLANVLIAVALVVHARLGMLESHLSAATPSDPTLAHGTTSTSPRAGLGTSAEVGAQRWVLGITVLFFVGFLALVLSASGMLGLASRAFVEWLALPALAYGSVAVVLFLAFSAWRERGPGGTPRGAVAWQLVALGLVVAGRLVDPTTLAAPAVLVAGFAVVARRRERRNANNRAPSPRPEPPRGP
jgi:hypothetical protein